MSLETGPLFSSELHALPVVVARLVLQTELPTPRLAGGAFGGGDVSLELDCVRARPCNQVDKGMRHSQTPVVGLRYFSDDEHAIVRDHDRLVPRQESARRKAPS